MKRIKSFSAIAVIITMLLSNVVFASPAKKIYSDDIELVMAADGKIALFDGADTVLDKTPYFADDVLMIPAEYVLESYGYTVSKSDTGLKAEGESEIELSIASNLIKINGEEKLLKKETVKNGSEIFCSEDILELLGCKVRTTKSGILAVSKSGNFTDFDENIFLHLQGVYVATDGKYGAAGTPAAPVDGLEAAKKIAVRYMKEYGASYPVHIFVKGGTYRFKSGVSFDETEFTLNTYKGLSIENFDESMPEFTGSVLLDQEKFTPVTDAVTLARVHKNARGKVASMDLREMGIKKLENLPNLFYYIYLNDIEQTNARWPNEGEATIFSVPQQNSFTFSETDPTRWTDAKNAYVFGHFSSAGWEWHQGIITSVNAATKTINIKGAENDVLKTSAVGTGWYAANLLEGLDMPGEWYVDTDNLKLYYYPPYRLKDQKLEMTTYLGTLLTFNNSKNLTVKGINFSKCGRAIEFTGNSINGVTITKCEFSHGQVSRFVAFPNGDVVYNVQITENKVYNLFGSFVYFRAGSLGTLKNGNCLVKNNFVAQTAQYYKSAGGMGGSYQTENFGNVGVECVNNVVQDIPGGAAVGWAGTNCKINNNEIINAGKYMSDYGAIYFGRSTSYFNMEVAHNFLHNFNNNNVYCGLYNDDAYSGANWHHNVCVDMYQPCIQAPGLNTKYMYNVTVNCAKTGSVGSRKSYGNSVYYKGSMWNETNKLLYENEEVYRKEYPQMFNWLERDKEFFNVCWDSIYYGNVGIGSVAINDFGEMEEYGAKEFEENGETISLAGKNSQRAGNPYYDYSDDFFVDPEHQNYNINPESTAAKDVPELLDIDVTKSGLTPEAEYLLEKPETGSHLKYPANGQKNLNASKITFSWDPVAGASFYRIIVATDPQLENVVYDKEVRENGNFNEITLDGFSNNCLYYWKVVAKSVTRQNQFEVDSIGGPYAFKTAVRDTLSKENLRLAITSFEEFCKNDLQDPNYEFDADFKASANAKLEECKKVYKQAKTQDELDKAEEEIYYVVKKSPFFMKVHFENIDGIYDQNAKWDTDGNISVDADGVLTFSSQQGTRAEARTAIKNKNSILCFKMKLADMGTIAGNYQGFDVKLNDTGNGYLIVFKNDIIEWQRIGKTLTEIPNDFIVGDKWYDVQAGGINTPNGVLQFFRVDGRIIYAELDQTSNQTRDEGFFRIRKNQLGNIQLKDMQEVPADGVLIDDILKDFVEPYSAKHLQTLFIGSADAMEMGSSALFSKLDKSILGELMYSAIKEEKVDATRADISQYKKKIEEMCVVAGYNQGLSENLFKNKIEFLYDDILNVEDIDTNGVTIYSWYKKLPDKFKAVATESMMKGNCKNIGELKKHITNKLFTTIINSCYTGFAGQSEYISEVLTKENADCVGIDISDYLALTLEQKLKANDAIGNGKHGNTERTLEELEQDIHDAVKNVK